MDAPHDAIRSSRILIVDDEAANLELLARLLKREKFTDIVQTTDPYNALEQFEKGTFDLVLLDLMMPGLDGFALLDSFQRFTGPTDFVPVLVLTADVSLPTRRRALSLGAKDFLTKPFDAIEVVLRVFNLLETRHLVLELQRHGLSSPITSRPKA
jgi:DNA-binding response OmpR family regulator